MDHGMTGEDLFLNQLIRSHGGFVAMGRLEDYDETWNGPLLGVSDGGEAAKIVADAAMASAKAATSPDSPSRVGVILDAERMGSGGEVPVGPDEIATVSEAALRRCYFSTNVGIRTNIRYHQPSPEVALDAGNEATLVEQILRLFQPFVETLDGKPRPLTVRLRVGTHGDLKRIAGLARKILTHRGDRIASPEVHRLGLLVVLDDPSEEQTARLEELIEHAGREQLSEVAIDGPIVEAARVKLGVQGVLNVLAPAPAQRLLRVARAARVRLTTCYEIDVESVTRTIWSGLFTARVHGLHGAKYGLVPLTLEEQHQVVRRIQRWTQGWTAIPAFYADTPLLTATDVYLSDRLVEAAEIWLRMVAEHGARVALFDCPDRHMPRIDVSAANIPRRILKAGDDDLRGAFELDGVRYLVELSRKVGVKILWSGGIQADQAFELAQLGVAGIFATSSTAKQAPVGPTLRSDPRLASQAVPTEQGVRRVHALLQAGFLHTALGGGRPDLAASIRARCDAVKAAALDSDALAAALKNLDTTLVSGWSALWSTTAP